MFAFVHIEKTAGTSFIHVLREGFFFQYIDVRPFYKSSQGLFLEQDLKWVSRILPTVKCIGGHSVTPYSDFIVKDESIQLITIMRDPVNRYLSQYQHWVEKKKLDISFEEFLGIEELRNFQTKKISSTGDVEEAKHILRHRFLLVGLVENFEEFIIMLNAALPTRSFSILTRQKNPNLNKVNREALIGQYKNEIVRNNARDIELYEYVRDTLLPNYKESFSNIGEGIQDRVLIKKKVGWRLFVDYLLRRIYIEPISGFLRVLHGKPYKGSY